MAMSQSSGLIKIESSKDFKTEECQIDKFKKLGINDINDFNKWVKQDLSILVNDKVNIKYSEDSGIGLVFDVSDGFQINSDIELLRIPQSSVLNIYNFLEIVKNLIEFEENVSKLSPNNEISQDEIEFYQKYKQSEIIKKCIKEITNFLKPKESLILVGYLIGFIVCFKLREFYQIKDEYGNRNNKILNPLCKFNQYLFILQKTKIESINSEDLISLDYYYELFPGETNFISQYLFLQEINEEFEFIKFINNEFGEKDKVNKIKLIDSDLFLQILSAVSSRTLEIPRQVEEEREGEGEGEGEEDEGDEGDDFTIDVTLVPILDFVNHDNIKLNSFFDIDRETNDIILKLDYELYKRNYKFLKDLKEIEIFISYSPIEEIFKFFFNYGFIPKISDIDSDDHHQYDDDDNEEEEISERIIQIIDIPFIGYFKFLNCDKIEEFIYKFKINPNIQFTITNKNKIRVNLLDNYSFVCFLPGFKIDDYIKDEDNEAGDEEEEGDENTVDFSVIESIVNQYSEEEITIGLIKLFKIFNKYLKYQIKILKNLKFRINEIDTEGGLNLIKLIEFKIELYIKFINKFNKLNEVKGDGLIDIYSLLEQPEDEEEYSQLIEIGSYRGPYRWYRSKLIVFDKDDMTEEDDDDDDDYEVSQGISKLGLD
ncbi:hypothetical protein B5S32_g4149 [[Candida] boidinii]|nr:hypothetical protein B5S32_g4149 [[Candida] boidinii]